MASSELAGPGRGRGLRTSFHPDGASPLSTTARQRVRAAPLGAAPRHHRSEAPVASAPNKILGLGGVSVHTARAWPWPLPRLAHCMPSYRRVGSLYEPASRGSIVLLFQPTELWKLSKDMHSCPMIWGFRSNTHETCCIYRQSLFGFLS